MLPRKTAFACEMRVNGLKIFTLSTLSCDARVCHTTPNMWHIYGFTRDGPSPSM